jgi:hypothetical protein
MGSFASETSLSPRFRAKYTAQLVCGSWRHSFDFVGAEGAISLNISGPHVYDGRENWSAGLEIHRRAPAYYQQDEPPSHDECHVLKCPCWHDGSSTYAQDEFLPIFLQGNINGLLRRLSNEAEERFPIVSPA